MLRDQLNRRQPIDNVSRNLLRLLTATCGYKEVRLLAVQRLEMWLQNPKVCCGGETVHERVSLGRGGSMCGCGCVPNGRPDLPAVDQASAGPADVCVHELQLAWLGRHGCHLAPDQDPPQTQGAPQPLYALYQVRSARGAAGEPGQRAAGAAWPGPPSPSRLSCPGSCSTHTRTTWVPPSSS